MNRTALKQLIHETIDENPKILKMENHLTLLQKNVGGLQHDVGSLKHDVSILKHDVGSLKHDVSILKHDVGSLKHDVSLIALKQDQTDDKIQHILDGMAILLKRDSLTDNHDVKIVELEKETTTLNSAVRGHVQNKKIHVAPEA